MAFNPRDVLRLGRWEDALDGETCDALIFDAPYGDRVHSGQRHGRIDGRYDRSGNNRLSVQGLPYARFSASDVRAVVESWAPRVRGWICSLTSHDLAPAWEAALQDAGRYVFAPLACVIRGNNIRLAGDGPSQWACWLVVARPRSKPYSKWGTLPGAYVVPPGFNDRAGGAAHGGSGRLGGKPLWLMEQIVNDYTRPGDLVCDPFSGRGTTLAAALRLGRSALGAEMDPETHAKGLAYLDKHGRARDLFAPKPLEAQALELPWSE